MCIWLVLLQKYIKMHSHTNVKWVQQVITLNWSSQVYLAWFPSLMTSSLKQCTSTHNTGSFFYRSTNHGIFIEWLDLPGHPMTAAVLRTIIKKCTALLYSVACGSVILYMTHCKIHFFNPVVQFEDCSLQLHSGDFRLIQICEM